MLSARYLMLISVAGIGALAGVLTVLSFQRDGHTGDLEGLAVGEMAAFKTATPPTPVPPFVFKDATGATLSLSDFKGRVVLLNLWATWCAPCLHEMPTLDHLQQTLGGEQFEVVALSLDQRGADAAKAMLFGKLKLKNLKLYIDDTAKAGRPLGVKGMPTTILIDRHGAELGRIAGPAVWDSIQARRLIEAAIAAGE